MTVVGLDYRVQWQNAAAAAVAPDAVGAYCYACCEGGESPCPACPLDHVVAENCPADASAFSNFTGCRGRMCRFLPLLDGDGAVAAVAVVGLNANANPSVLDSMSFFRELVEVMNDGLGVTDAEGRVIYVNDRLCAMTGYSAEELVGQPADSFVAPEDQAHFEEQVRQRRAGTPGAPYELTWLHRDGSRVYTRMAPQAILNAQGRFRFGFAVVTDITERRRAAEKLAQSEDRFRTILEHSQDIAYKLDLATLTYEYISPSVKTVTGYEVHELQSLGYREVLELVHPEDRPGLNPEVRLRMGAAGTVEFRLRIKSGEYRWLSDSAMMLHDAQGAPQAVVGTLRDVTDRHRTEEALRVASRLEATATLAAGVAHEFNNLMASVLGNAELLEREIAPSPDFHELLHEIIASAQRAGELTHQLLAYASGGKHQPRLLNLNEHVREVLHIEKAVLARGADIAERLAPDLWAVEADARQIEQVVLNLTLNAVEATASGGRVEVTTRNIAADDAAAVPELDARKHVCLSVEDDGQGMDEETRRRIFEPFFSTKVQGRGLGLAAVYGIVKNHGGVVQVQSEPGRGARVDVYFPAGEPGDHSHAPQPPPIVGGTETVLIVDDEEMVRAVTRRLLERLGYRVLVAATSREAVEIASGHNGPIDLVLLDLNMSDAGACQTLPLLQARRTGVPVIICSGGYDGDETEQLFEHGASGYIQKPFKVAGLSAEIRRVLDR